MGLGATQPRGRPLAACETYQRAQYITPFGNWKYLDGAFSSELPTLRPLVPTMSAHTTMTPVPASLAGCKDGVSGRQCPNVDSLQSHRMSGRAQASGPPSGVSIMTVLGGPRRAVHERRSPIEIRACARWRFVTSSSPPVERHAGTGIVSASESGWPAGCARRRSRRGCRVAAQTPARRSPVVHWGSPGRRVPRPDVQF